MSTIYMIHGFVGAGKTTFSKKLEVETSAVRFSPDEWMIDLYGVNPPKENFRVYEDNIKRLIWKMVVILIQKNVDVILDYGFWKRADRDRMKLMAKDMNAKVVLYNLQCPDDVIISRVLKRSSELPEGALYIDENAIGEFRQYFEPIQEDEDSITINNG